MPNYIVDPLNGIDTNPGSEVYPFKTPYKLSTVLRPGDFGIFRGGAYTVSDNGSLIVTRYSGTASAPITYMAYAGELPIFKGQSRGINLGHSYLVFDGIGIINDSQAAGMISGIETPADGPQYVTFKNMIVRNMTRGATSFGFNLPYLKYGKIQKCVIDHIGCPSDEGTESGNGIGLGGGWNIVEETTTDYCGHAGIFATGAAAAHGRHVLRKNTLIGTWGVCAEYLSQGTTANPLLVEDNIMRNVSKLEDGLWRNPTWQQMGSRTIHRRNLLYSGIGAGIQIYSRSDYQSKYCRYYNNIIYRCGGPTPPAYLCPPYEINEEVAGTQGDNIVKNSIHYLNSRNDRATFAGTGNQGVIAFLSNSWNETDPRFVSEANRDFHLREGSPCIDAGEFLTRAAAGGSGRTLSVLDAKYFCDGWGIIEGDYIQFEGTSEAIQIESIDYQANIIVLKESASWQVGQGVSLPFLGSRPDIGAFEYLGGYMPTASINVILNILGIPGISLTVTPASRSIQKGQSTTFQIAVAAVDGYAGAVTFEVTSVLPAGVTASFLPASIQPGNSTTLTIATSVSSPVANNVQIDIKATGA